MHSRVVPSGHSRGGAAQSRVAARRPSTGRVPRLASRAPRSEPRRPRSSSAVLGELAERLCGAWVETRQRGALPRERAPFDTELSRLPGLETNGNERRAVQSALGNATRAPIRLIDRRSSPFSQGRYAPPLPTRASGSALSSAYLAAFPTVCRSSCSRTGRGSWSREPSRSCRGSKWKDSTRRARSAKEARC